MLEFNFLNFLFVLSGFEVNVMRKGRIGNLIQTKEHVVYPFLGKFCNLYT